MGEQLLIPDKRGVVIPVALIAVLFTIAVAGVQGVYRVGLIVKGQEAQAAEWQEIKRKIEAIDELEGRVAAMDKGQTQFQGFVTNWIRTSTDDQIEQKATLVSFREDLRRQERDRRLLQDYVEGRIGTMPYRPSVTNRGPEE